MTQMLFKVLTCFLLLSIVYFNYGSAQLICWRCDPCPEPHDNKSSLVSPVTCTSSQTSCVKNSFRVLGQTTQISKGCVESCTPSSSTFFGPNIYIGCCSSSYCNSSIRNQFSLYLYGIFIFIITIGFYT